MTQEEKIQKAVDFIDRWYWLRKEVVPTSMKEMAGFLANTSGHYTKFMPIEKLDGYSFKISRVDSANIDLSRKIITIPAYYFSEKFYRLMGFEVGNDLIKIATAMASGSIIHEGGHLAYTESDYDKGKMITDKLTFDVKSSITIFDIKSAMNLIEDLVIETLLSRQPFSEFLQIKNRFLFSERDCVAALMIYAAQPSVANALNALYGVKSPDLRETILGSFSDNVQMILRKALKVRDNPSPSVKTNMTAALLTALFIDQEAAESESEDKDESKDESEGESKGESKGKGKSSSESKATDGEGSSFEAVEGDDEAEDESEDESEDENETEDESETEPEQEPGKAPENMIDFSEVIKKIIEVLTDLAEAESLGNDFESSANKTLFKMTHSANDFIDEKGDYHRISPTVTRDILEIRNYDSGSHEDQIKSSNYVRYLKSLRTTNHCPGVASNKGPQLVNTRINRIITDQKIFAYQQSTAQEKRIELIVLVDASGSMCSMFADVLKEAESIFNAARSAKIACQIFAHTSLGGSFYKEIPFLIKIAAYDMKETTSANEKRFYNARNIDQKQNYDGFMITEVCKYFTNRTARKVLIVLSDGEPASGDYQGDWANNHTIKAIKTAREQKTTVFCISLVDDVIDNNNKIYGTQWNLHGNLENEMRKLVATIAGE